MKQIDLKSMFPKNIILVGLGGGGSRTLAELPGFIFEAYNLDLCKLSLKNQPLISIVDHDKVESRNCFRQHYFSWDVGELKVAAQKARYNGLLNIKAVPDASNIDSIPKIFDESVLSNNFCVISKLDHAVSTSQIYHWLMENAPDNITWTWFFSGTSLIEQEIQGVYRKVDKKITLPYVTAYMYGKVNGQPIVPDLSDSRFASVPGARPLAPHITHHDVLPDVTGIHGRASDGGGCGLSDGDMVQQAGIGNLLSTSMTMRQMRSFYMDGVVIPEIIEQNYTTQAILPYTLEEVLYPEQYPELKEILSNDDSSASTVDSGANAGQPESEQVSNAGDATDRGTDSEDPVREPDSQES